MQAIELASDQTHRVLAYIEALERQGYRPTPAEVAVYADQPLPLPATVTSGQWAASLRAMMDAYAFVRAAGTTVSPAEKPLDYMERLGWIRESDGTVELTPLGRAFVRALNAQSAAVSPDEVVNLVLSEDDPTAFARVFARIAQAGQGMLVDPYLRWEQIIMLGTSTSIRRVLTSKKLKTEELDAIRAGLPMLHLDGVLEARMVPKGLHDRCLVPDNGKVQLIGTSLTGVGTNLTIMGEMPDISHELRQKYNDMWESAEVLATSGSSEGTEQVEPG